MKLPAVRLCIAAIASTAASGWLWRSLCDHAPVDAPATLSSCNAAPAAPPAVATPEQPPAPVQPPGPHDFVIYPDGSRWPALNGVTEPPRLAWHHGRPFAPVTGRERGRDGRDWYVHADGSRSTTWWSWRPDLGRWAAITDMTSPAGRQPIADADAPTAGR